MKKQKLQPTSAFIDEEEKINKKVPFEVLFCKITIVDVQKQI